MTALSGNNCAMVHRTGLVLVVVDMQEKLAGAMELRAPVESGAARLVRACGVLKAPVIVTRQYPEGLGETVATVAAALEDAASETDVSHIDKTAFCACNEPVFLEALHDTGRSQVVVCGMETHICVTQTALSLKARGHSVFVVADACCSRRARDHDTALDRLRAAEVSVVTSESVMYEALGRSGTDEFKRLLAIVKEG